MKELQYFENKISNIIEKNEINNFYLFAETILDYEKKYGTEEVLNNFKIDKEELFYLKIYADAMKIGDFDKDIFKDFNLKKLSEIDEISLKESLKKLEDKYQENNHLTQQNLINSFE